MSYVAKENSIHSGEPIEVLKLTGDVKIYRFTTDADDTTVDGEVYKPIYFDRNAVEVSSFVGSTQTIDFNVPSDSDIAKDYARLKTPQTLYAELRRTHRGDSDWEMIWQGEVIGFETTGRLTRISTGSTIQSALAQTVSGVFYQQTCNHVLFDARCKVSRSAFTTTGEVTAIGPVAFTVDDDGVTDHYLKLGEAVNLRTGERRMIGDNLANVVKIGFQFTDIVIGDTISLTAGCNHSKGMCKTKFNNYVNYGGFDLIPSDDIFGK